MRNKRPMSSSLNIEKVWGAIVKAFEEIFQLLQLHLMRGSYAQLDL
jgi:hypothetical protein